MKRRNIKGASLVESMFAICIMCLLFFALLQIWYWCNARLFCRYGAYYAVKAKSLGFNNPMVLRAARVAAIPASGPARNKGNAADNARAYMLHGDGSGVSYQYWHPSRAGEPELQVSGTFQGDDINAKVKIRYMTMLHDSLEKFFGITEPPDPQADVRMYNYGNVYLEE